MPSESQIAAQTIYANILGEINLRVDAINHCVTGFSGLAPPFVKDMCYIQIRMICELVALGCLVAHGDIKQTASETIQRAWSADKIMSTLEGLHPHFYPQPVTQTKTATGWHLQRKPSPLSKSELLKLYHKCGDMLHRGSLRKLLKGQFPHQVNFPEITAPLQKLIDLLSQHVLVMQSGEQVFIAMLKNVDQNMRPQVAIAEAPLGGTFDYASPDFLKDPP
jgi:hypothetical protein